VEDVLNLGNEITVRVDDIDPQGKVSLTPVGDGDGESADAAGGDRVPAAVPAGSSESEGAAASNEPTREYASFEDAFEGEAKEKFGDLGPADTGGGGRGDGGGRGGGRGGPRRNQRRGGPGRR
jgi:hypothetical protein